MHPFRMFLPLALPGIIIGFLVFWRGTSLRRAGHPWLASGLEVRAFHRLEQKFSRDHHLISAHMLLADVIGRQNLNGLSIEDRQFAWRAHCDFVIVARESLEIVRVVEVNGGFHRDVRQQFHDGHKREILAGIGIALEVWD